ncbi:MAG: ABC transporter substrate-binding protein [Planctomycetota bacterium]
MRWIFACVLFLVACGSETSAPEPEPKPETSTPAPERERVIYAGSAWYGHAPVWVGLRKGIFAKHGFEVVDKSFGSSGDRVTALEAGNAQFASLGQVAMLGAMGESRTGFYWVANQNIAPGNEGIVAIGIDRIEDLKGKSIALQPNTSIHLTVALLLKKHGLSLKDVDVKFGSDDAIVQMVRNGDAQAGAIWEPFYGDLKQLEGAKVLGTDRDTPIYEKFNTMSGPDVICASRAWVDADPARAQRFFRAYFEAVQWCADNPEELTKIAVERTGKDPKIVAAVLANFTWIGWDAQKVNMSDARMFGQTEVAAQLLVEMGSLQSVPKFRDWTWIKMFWE